jgi:hypothetical protein
MDFSLSERILKRLKTININNLKDKNVVLLPDFFIDHLRSENNYHKMAAVLIIANLTSVDKNERFEKVFNEFYDNLKSEKTIVPIYVIKSSSKIVNFKPNLEEKIFIGLMIASVLIVIGSLILIVAIISINGAPSLSIDILLQTSEGGFYLGPGGGFLNAIIGSMLLALPASCLAFLISIAIALYLQKDFLKPKKGENYGILNLIISRHKKLMLKFLMEY